MDGMLYGVLSCMMEARRGDHLYLKEVEMENFKSFKKRIRIPVLEGYTAITGPNGCGKSNIADAVLFVLGPRSSRVLRAGRLTDLIFNGGHKDKKRAKECAVSLTFDNTDRTLPVNRDEVKLTRVVRISEGARLPDGGEAYNSYFYINGSKSSLTEFDNLLIQARISADGYNMVQQGDIVKIVSMGNVERRRIMDSIAGITKFDEDIQKAETKREYVEENIGKIKIIIEELGKQLKQLDKDRTSALRYKEFKEKLNLAKAQMAYKNREMVEEQINAIKRRIEKDEEEQKKFEAKKTALNAKISQVIKELEDVEAEIAERSGEEYKKIREKIDHLKIERARAKSALENSTDEIKRLKSELQAAKKEYGKTEKESALLNSERTNLEEDIEHAVKEAKRLGDSIKDIEDKVSKADSSALPVKKEIVELNNEIESGEERSSGLRLEGAKCTELIEHVRREEAELEELRKQYEFSIQDANYSIKEAKSKLSTSQKSQNKIKAELEVRRKREEELAKQSLELESAIKTLTRDYNQLKAEVEATKNVELGYSRAVSALLEARDKGTIKGIHGTLAELTKVDDKYSTALSVAAGQRMQAVVVDNDEIAAKSIRYLKDKKIGRATFLPLNKMLGSRPSGKALMVVKNALGFAIDLIKFDEKYRDAFWYALGDTIVVDNLNNARTLMGGVRLITIDGELIERTGAITGGLIGKHMLKIGPTKKELETVASKLRKAVEQSEKVNKELTAIKKELMELESSLKDDQVEGTSLNLGPLEAQKKEYRSRLKGIEKELELKKKKIEELEEELEKVRNESKSLSAHLEELKNKREEKKKLFAEFTPQKMAKNLQSAQKDKLAVSEKLSQLKSQLDTLKAKVELQDEKKSELEERLKGIEEQIKAHKDKIRESHTAEEKLETELRGLQKIDQNADKEMKELSSKRDAKYKERVELESDLGNLADRMHTKEDFLNNLRIDIQSSEHQLKAAEEELKNYDTEFKDKLPSAEELKKTVLESEAAINTLGNVNMNALEDYDEKKKRCDELNLELKELRSQKNKLIGLVGQLGDKKKNGLIAVFHKINENFKGVYEEISEGGEAELVLENEEDPFQGGLIIKAKPRHKKTMRLEALSGGEKSLVSMAFIFAIQEYEPSPFYLLDEVDQNLDALNAEKVAKMIHRNSSTAQFIQISLRKVTLKESNHVVGVTMEDGCTSNVVMKVSIEDVVDEKDLSSQEGKEGDVKVEG